MSTSAGNCAWARHLAEAAGGRGHDEVVLATAGTALQRGVPRALVKWSTEVWNSGVPPLLRKWPLTASP